MPEISRFLGVVIGMFYSEHGVPHFHAVYGEYEASIEIASERVHGALPRRALALVLEWNRLHRQELLENWERARPAAEPDHSARVAMWTTTCLRLVTSAAIQSGSGSAMAQLRSSILRSRYGDLSSSL